MALLPSDPAGQRKMLIALVPVLGAFAYWYFLHGDYTTEVEQMESRLESLQTQNDVARARAMRGSGELEERLAQFERHIIRLEQLVPKREEVAGLLSTLAERANETGVELARLNPGADQVGLYYNRQTFDVMVYGSYHKVARFLAELGSLPRIITPIDLSLRDREQLDRDGGRILEAQFQIETYVLPTGPPPAAPAPTTGT